MSDLIEKEKTAIQRLKNFAPYNDLYHVCYSGGKDSDVLRILCKLADVPHELHYNVVSADAPETVHYIKSLGCVILDLPRYKDGTVKNMWNLIPKKYLPPTRLNRYCCSELKEQGGKGKLKVIGCRWAESKNRSENGALLKIIGKPKKALKFAEDNNIKTDTTRLGGVIMNYDNSDSRRMAEFCYRTSSTMLSPIIDWSDSDVWDFLKYYGCSSNPLYQCGFSRVGCIGCPLGGYKSQKRELSIYPRYYANYLRAFDKMLVERNKSGRSNESWESGKDVMAFWLGENQYQLYFDDFDLVNL